MLQLFYVGWNLKGTRSSLPLHLHVSTPAALTERSALLTLLSEKKTSPHHITEENRFVNTESKLKNAGVFCIFINLLSQKTLKGLHQHAYITWYGQQLWKKKLELRSFSALRTGFLCSHAVLAKNVSVLCEDAGVMIFPLQKAGVALNKYESGN